MGRNEIRLRRNQMSTGRIARHRNYSKLLEQHDREMKIKRIARTFTYFLVILFIIILLVIIFRWEKRVSKKINAASNTVTQVVKNCVT